MYVYCIHSVNLLISGFNLLGFGVLFIFHRRGEAAGACVSRGSSVIVRPLCCDVLLRLDGVHHVLRHAHRDPALGRVRGSQHDEKVGVG